MAVHGLRLRPQQNQTARSKCCKQFCIATDRLPLRGASTNIGVQATRGQRNVGHCTASIHVSISMSIAQRGVVKSLVGQPVGGLRAFPVLPIQMLVSPP